MGSGLGVFELGWCNRALCYLQFEEMSWGRRVACEAERTSDFICVLLTHSSAHVHTWCQRNCTKVIKWNADGWCLSSWHVQMGSHWNCHDKLMYVYYCLSEFGITLPRFHHALQWVELWQQLLDKLQPTTIDVRHHSSNLWASYVLTFWTFISCLDWWRWQHYTHIPNHPGNCYWGSRPLLILTLLARYHSVGKGLLPVACCLLLFILVVLLEVFLMLDKWTCWSLFTCLYYDTTTKV